MIAIDINFCCNTMLMTTQEIQHKVKDNIYKINGLNCLIHTSPHSHLLVEFAKGVCSLIELWCPLVFFL